MKYSFVAAIPFLFLSACASYSGSGLVAGQSAIADVMEVMGPPALQWDDADGSRHMAYPRGPSGVHTYMVSIGANGKLQRIENVLSNDGFQQIKAGMNKDQVQRVLGPSISPWTTYFPARDELVWEWRYCDDWNQLARFMVLFDGTTQLVRSSMTLTEDQMGECGPDGGCRCSH